MVNNNNSTFLTMLLCGVVLMVISPDASAAAGDNIAKIFKDVWNAATGDIGRYIAAIAVVVTGLLALFERISWGRAAQILFGIIIVFGSLKFVDWIITLVKG